MERRREKINQALANLRHKQAAEVDNMLHRVKTAEEEHAKEWQFET